MDSTDETTILRIGAEGGCLTLKGRRRTSGDWEFALKRDERALEPDAFGTSDWVTGWPAALRLLDRYPWAGLYPVAIHPAFAGQVLEAARERADAWFDEAKWRRAVRVSPSRAAGKAPSAAE